MRYILIFLLLLQFSILSPSQVIGQQRPQLPASPQDTLISGLDTVTVNTPKGDIETTIKYSARDSIQFEVDRKVVHLYGDAKITYGSISLDAAYIMIDYDTNLLTATPLTDSTGTDVGVPVFVDGSEKYAAKRISYNFKTKKGRIAEVVTQQGEGYIHGEIVKKNENNEAFIYHAKYTTCNLEHPHFYIDARRIKAIPNSKIMSGPFNLVISDIPTPVGFLFGLFPTPKSQRRSSGVIVPSYGESSAQGFYLRGGGYYFAWNDYIGTRLTGDIYSLGGYNVTVDNSYRKRYAYSGNLNIQYQYFKNDEADIAASLSTNDLLSALPPSTKTFWINWTHTPEQKPGRGRFTASVNAGSTLHQRLHYTNTTQYLSPTFNSSISYQKNITNTPFSYTAKLRQGQNSNGTMNFVLPDLSFTMSQISLSEIFSDAPATGRWYEQFTFGYGFTANNTISNITTARTAPSGLTAESILGLTAETASDIDTISLNDFSRLWKNGRRSADHSFQLGLGSYKVMKYLNFSPSISYAESWVDKKYTYTYDPESQKVRIDTANFGRVYRYNAGASLSTNIYGTVYVKGKRVEAIRHLLRPSVSYNYTPDFGSSRYGFYQTVQTGVNSDTQVPIYQTLSRFGSGASVPGRGLQSAMSFSLQNSVEMKVRSKSDSTANAFEKVSLINNLGLSGSYNFAADSLNLSTISLNMNTTLLKVINLNFSSTFDPYKVDENGRKINEYVFDINQLKLARLTNANLSLTASLNPRARRSETTAPTNLPDLQQNNNPFMPEYVDFKIPWTLNVDFTLYYAPALTATDEDRFNKTFGVNGSLNLTEKWKVTYNANYDFTNNNISYSQVSIYRDLHCWDMSISWIPFGFQRGYNLTINARSSLLRDLKLTKRNYSSGLY